MLAICLLDLSMSTLLITINHIVSSSPQEQMSCIDTERLITMMANKQPIGNQPIS
jgi:hypothetical protein